MSRVLVTGANGFVGKAVCRSLPRLGMLPIAGIQDANRWPSIRAAVPEMQEFTILGDISKTLIPPKALYNIETIIHLASRVHIMHEQPPTALHKYRQTNVVGTKALAQTAADAGVRRFVFVSTSKVNGESTEERSFSESDEPQPLGPYAISKWEAEEELRSIAAKTGLEVVIVRPPLVYGPEVKANFLALLKLVQKRIPLPIPDIGNRRSFVFVDNLADFLVRCANQREAKNETFFVSDGEDISTRDLIRRIANASEISVRFLPAPAIALQILGEIFGKRAELNRLLGSLAIDSTKARNMLSWSPPFSLNEGLKTTVQWYLRK